MMLYNCVIVMQNYKKQMQNTNQNKEKCIKHCVFSVNARFWRLIAPGLW